jgi:hypothetical protein
MKVIDKESSLKKEYANTPEESLSIKDEADFKAISSPGYSTEYHPLAYESPVELLEDFHPAIVAGQIELDGWQKETLDFIANKKEFKLPLFTKAQPLEMGVVTCNGSGKDAFLIAGTALWVTTCIIRHRIIITSASYNQMIRQTQSYVRFLADCISKKLASLGVCEQALISKRDHVVSRLTGSEIVMFVTDDPGRAEGFHPWPDCPTQELSIITNEAKTIPPPLFSALRRCTYNRWLEISSPGDTSGHFYKFITQRCQAWEDGYVPGKPIYRRISAYDCAHISDHRIESAKDEMGDTNPLFRSMYLAEFVSLAEEVVITQELLDKALQNPPEYNDRLNINQVGVDIALTGDKSTIYQLKNNKLIKIKSFRSNDSEVIAIIIKDTLESLGVNQEDVFIDDGYIGHAVIDKLARLGWRVNRVINQSTALFKKQYGNRGAELYFNFKRLIELRLLILEKDNTLLHQELTSRHYAQHKSTGKLILESKKESRAKGRGSPDDADGAILACAGITKEILQIGKAKTKVVDQTLRYTNKYLQKHGQNQIQKLRSLPPTSTKLVRYGDHFLLPDVGETRKATTFNPLRILSNLSKRR